MAVTSKPSESNIKILVNKTVDGKTKTFTRTYSKVKPNAEDAAVYGVAEAIAGLQENILNRIMRTDSSELSETI